MTFRLAHLDTYASTPPGIATVYTDGSSTGMSEGPAGWAWYVSDEEWSCGGLTMGTNNIAEIMAIEQAVLSLPRHEPLAIVSDSQYAIGAVFKWFEAWARGGWRTSTGSEVKNVDLIVATREAVYSRTAMTLVKHVRGHGKDKSVLPVDLHGNKLADMLAVEARLRTAESGVDQVCTSFEREIVHGRGRKKRPFTEELVF